REGGWGIALDDVGTDATSLALMPFLDPDVIKLDLRLIQDTPTEDLAEVVNAVNAEAERSNLTILSEGIETEEHVRTSLAFGATLGQGWMFGKPAPLPDPLPDPQREYDFALTYNREFVVETARNMMSKITPHTGPAPLGPAGI